MSSLTRSTFRIFPLALLLVVSSHAHAAFNFQFSQSGSVNPNSQPASYTYEYTDFGTVGSAKEYCELAASQSGLSSDATYTCSYEHYTSASTFDFGGGSCADFGCGSGGGGSLSFQIVDINIYTGTGSSRTSSCNTPTGITYYNGNPIGENSSVTCSVYTHTYAPPVVTPAATASISANPASVMVGGTSALTYSCTNATSASISSIGSVSPTSGTVSVSPGNTTTYTLTCTGAGGSGTAAATVSVVQYPDLTASTGGAVSTTVNQATTFSGTTSNIGSGAASGNFSDLFIFYNADQSTVNGSSYAPLASPLAFGASASRSAAYTFTSPGTYYYRLCADYTGAIAESNESNNCSGLTSVTVAAAPAADLTAGATSPSSAVAGTPVSIQASATNIGNAASGGFPVLFQVYDAAGSVISVMNSAYYSLGVGETTTLPNASYTFASAGTYYTRACANTNTSYVAITTESDYANNCGPLTTVTVSAAPVFLADLTAGSVSPSTATAGQSRTFSAPVTNIGNASSGGFPTLFQVANAGITATIGTVESSYISLTSNETYTVSAAYTFGSSGTYNIRACANNNSTWVNITSESNYGNNCGPWTVVTVTNPAPTGSLSCSVDNQSPVVGDIITYRATPSGGAGSPYVWTASDGTGGYGSNSTASRTFTGNGTYGMTVDGGNVISPASCPLVTAGCAAPHTATLDASRTRVNQGEGVTLTYQAQGINTSCVIAGPAGTITTIAASTCVVPSGSVPSGAIQTQSRFTITCDGSVADDVVVNVIPKFQEF